MKRRYYYALQQKCLPLLIAALLVLGMPGALAFAAPAITPAEEAGATSNAESEATEATETAETTGSARNTLEEESTAPTTGSDLSEPISTLAVVSTPESAFSTSPSGAGVRITGFSQTWLNQQEPDSDGILRIDLVIPRAIHGKIVVAIGSSAFDDGNYSDSSAKQKLRITGIDFSLATELTSISENAFRSFSTGAIGSFPKESEAELYTELSVDTFALPKNLKTIGAGSFAGLVGLRGNLVMPDGVLAVPDLVFYKCSGLASLDLNNVKQLGSSFGGTFMSCSGLTDINLRRLESFTGCQNFSCCTALAGTVTIPASLTSFGSTVGNNQFSACGTAGPGFQLVFDLEDSRISSIPGQIFFKSKVIGNLTIPEGVKSIGSHAFSETQISRVSLPSSLTSIAQSFADISTLTSVNFSETGTSLTLANYSFRNNQIPVLVLPPYLTSVGQYSFGAYQNTSYISSVLKTVYLNSPAATTSIGSGNFASDTVVIAPNKEAYAAWAAKPGSNVESQITYELDVVFCNSDTGRAIDGLSSITKLYNKSIWYKKENETGTWKKDVTGSLPAVAQAGYPDAEGWSFTIDGTLVRDTESQLVLADKLYPAPGFSHEYLWYGQYPQRPLTADEIACLDRSGWEEGADYSLWDGAGNTEYFKIEPIRWRIMQEDNGTYLLMSEAILDGGAFSEAPGTSWENSTVKSFLNDGFYDSAFVKEEQARIGDTYLSDVDTTNKVFLPSMNDMNTLFVDDSDIMPHTTHYSYYGVRKTSVVGLATPSFQGSWWLRDNYSPANNLYVYADGLGASLTAPTKLLGMRPMITITLAKDDFFEKPGTYADPYVIATTLPLPPDSPEPPTPASPPTPPAPDTPAPVTPAPEATPESTATTVDNRPATALSSTPSSSTPLPTLPPEQDLPAPSGEDLETISELGFGVPLGSLTHQDVWSLLSLLMSLIALLASIILAIRHFAGVMSSEQHSDTASSYKKGGRDTTKRLRVCVLRIFALAAGLLPGSLFLVLNNLSLELVWIDQYTLFIALAFVVAAVALILHIVACRHNKRMVA